jgi:antitoxin MazE
MRQAARRAWAGRPQCRLRQCCVSRLVAVPGYLMYIVLVGRIAMQVQIARWGNSLGLRIPKDLAEHAGLRAGARVEIAADGDRLVITPTRRRYRLAELLEGVTPEEMRTGWDGGPDVGREIVEGGDLSTGGRRSDLDLF